MNDTPSSLPPDASSNSETPTAAPSAAVTSVAPVDTTQDNKLRPLPKPDDAQPKSVFLEHLGAPISAPQPPSEKKAKKKTFVIENVSVAYQPRKGEVPYHRSDVVLESDSTRKAPYALVIEEQARETIFEHIGWRAVRAENNVEQGGILVGEVIETPDGRFFGIAKQALPGLGGRGSSTYLQMDHSAWKAMYDQVDELSHLEESGNQIIGWYHTHPQNLGVFMSGVDMNTQKTMFSRPWHFAVVFNPHRKLWKVFRGAEAKECPGYFLKHKTWEVLPEKETPNPNAAHGSTNISGDTRAPGPPDTAQSRSIKSSRFPIRIAIAVTTLCAVFIALQQHFVSGIKKKTDVLETEVRAINGRLHQLESEHSNYFWFPHLYPTLPESGTLGKNARNAGKAQGAPIANSSEGSLSHRSP
jgi:proteasome lid subunit RPN8/RPN11